MGMPNGGAMDKDELMRLKLEFTKNLNHVTNKIHATSNIDEIMLDVSKDICTLFNADRLTIYVVGDDNISPLVNDELEIFGQALNALPARFGEIGPNDFRISSMGPNGETAYTAMFPALASSHTEFLAVWSGYDNIAQTAFETFGHRLGATDRPEAFFEVATGELLIYGSNQDDAFGLSADGKNP